MSRTCSSCQTTLNLISDFYTNQTESTGYHYECKECMKESQAVRHHVKRLALRLMKIGKQCIDCGEETLDQLDFGRTAPGDGSTATFLWQLSRGSWSPAEEWLTETPSPRATWATGTKDMRYGRMSNSSSRGSNA